jgi:hypothetical protein
MIIKNKDGTVSGIDTKGNPYDPEIIRVDILDVLLGKNISGDDAGNILASTIAILLISSPDGESPFNIANNLCTEIMNLAEEEEKKRSPWKLDAGYEVFEPLEMPMPKELIRKRCQSR